VVTCRLCNERVYETISLPLFCREYLGCEYAEKFGQPRIFSKETMPGSAPKVRNEDELGVKYKLSRHVSRLSLVERELT